MIFPITFIPFLNIFIIVVTAFLAYSGYKSGLLLKALDCLSMIVIGLIAWFLSPMLAKSIHLYPANLTPMENTVVEPFFYNMMNRFLLFAIIFMFLLIVVLLLHPLFKGIGSLPIIAQLNKLLGILFGFVQSFIIIFIITIIFQTPLFANGNMIIESSYLNNVSKTTDGILFFASHTMEELRSVQKIVTPNSKLDAKNLDDIRGWLKKQGLEEIKIQEFIDSLGEI
ncbi:MAG: CvpA family protein [Erysipelotrichaceae bacterium]